MKLILAVALTMFGPFAAISDGQTACKAFFQVLRADEGTPGLRVGLDPAQKKWWQGKGQMKYPGLCLDGSVMSPDKPRFLVIWSKSTTIGQSSIPPNEVYGQTASALQTTAPSTRIYQPRWDQASVTIINVQYDGSLLLPAVYYEADQHSWVLVPDSAKVLDSALKYLCQERVLLPKPN